MLVIDASAALESAQRRGGFRLFGGEQLLAPPLLWPEARSALHERMRRGDVSREQAFRSMEALLQAGIQLVQHRNRRSRPQTHAQARNLLSHRL